MALDLAALGLNTGEGAQDASTIEEALNAPDENTDDSSTDINLDTEDNDEPPVEDDSDNDEESEENEEKEEEDPEVDLDNEDELELSKIPKRQEILAKYPKIFKDFPALDHIIHREHAFAEVFPTVNDAKTAKESVTAFNKFQGDLLNGDIKGVLNAVKQTDSKAFNKLVDNFLTSLGEVDPTAHAPITQRVTKSILSYIHNMSAESLRKNPNNERAEQMKLASEIIHEALYDTSEVTPYNNTSSKNKEEENPEIEAFKKEKESFEQSRYQTAFTTVATKMNTTLTNAVTRDIDPKGILPPYVKKTVVSDVMGELDRQLSNDTRFRGLVDKLWIKAKEANYSQSAMSNIEKALKEKAKTILPAIMRAKKGEAMKGLTNSNRNNDTKLKKQPKEDNEERRAPQNKVTSTRRDSDKLPRDGESIRDFLMRD